MWGCLHRLCSNTILYRHYHNSQHCLHHSHNNICRFRRFYNNLGTLRQVLRSCIMVLLEAGKEHQVWDSHILQSQHLASSLQLALVLYLIIFEMRTISMTDLKFTLMLLLELGSLLELQLFCEKIFIKIIQKNLTDHIRCWFWVIISSCLCVRSVTIFFKLK